jgi:cysteine desulfurase
MTEAYQTTFGNAGSRTHRYGTEAAQAVRRAREQVASVVGLEWDTVIFTSGATESNNLAILGLAEAAETVGRKHIVSTQIEHKAVLEPLDVLVARGFEVTLLPPTSTGAIDPAAVKAALRPDTALVSVMHVNNETGVVQPLDAIAATLQGHPAVFHTDAAQGYGKDLQPLRNNRIDLISVSAHKIFGPKGIGALIVRPTERVQGLTPLLFGGGQERGMRPGTLAVPLIIGFGVAATAAMRDHALRRARCAAFRSRLLDELSPLGITIHGDATITLPNTLNFSYQDIDSEAVMLALRDCVAISNGSACTSSSYALSHVLTAMQLPAATVNAATRWSWCHFTAEPAWRAITQALRRIR